MPDPTRVPQPGRGASEASAALRVLAERLWDTFASDNPVAATVYGDRRFDDRLPDRSADAAEASVARLRAILADARALDPEQLSTAERVTHRMLLDTAIGLSEATATRID